jgi:hypothetical protein
VFDGCKELAFPKRSPIVGDGFTEDVNSPRVDIGVKRLAATRAPKMFVETDELLDSRSLFVTGVAVAPKELDGFVDLGI